MYLAHFGLHELPFGLTPDTSFVVTTRGHQEALNTLLVALAGGEGFIQISGEVGTGKTLLCRRFLATLPAGTQSCYIPDPSHTPRSLLLALAEELGLAPPASSDEASLHRHIGQALLERAAEGRRVVVCIDEAQALKLASLETLRLLSNLETEKRKLMQVVLFGQPELDARLARPELRQLRQRIAFRYRLGTLGRDEIGPYLEHRLRVAGRLGAPLFSPAAVATLQRASGGTPRLVNVLAHKALLAAWGAGDAGVERHHVHLAARDTIDSSATGFGWRRWLFR